MSVDTREIHLVSRPAGEPTEDDFALVRATLPAPGPGQILVRNLAMSVDPYMRGRMRDAPSYAPPWRLNEAAQGGAVGEVIASQSDGIAVGDLVVHGLGWREHALLAADHAAVVPRRDDIAPSLYLGALGMPGRTAYVGLYRVARFRPGDTVFVSAAAGAVGSMVGQLARVGGAGRVIGSAGSPAKISYLLDDLGFDAAFDYHDGSAEELLAAAAPDGIDVYFDNVGGTQLEAALAAIRPFGRVIACGSISRYNDERPEPGPRNLFVMVTKRLRLQGFIVSDHDDRYPDFLAEVAPWVRDGELRYRETVVDGIENVPAAFAGLFRGDNVGKMLVRVGPADD
jgi:NADPH-dependent curcumin reductase CurA